MERFKAFIAELRRRRVLRALATWAILSFAVLQVYEPIMHGLHLPEWTLSFVVVLLGLGYPVTLALSWTFDLTSAGIERTAARPDAGLRGARLAWLLLGLGALVALPGLGWYLLRGPGDAARSATSGPAPLAPAAPALPSIAVLPFADMSAAHDQEYFADGVAEEILNLLAHVEGLKVIGRTSSFSFKGRNEDLRAIGQKLGVAHVLEGSLRKDRDQVRVTAQLIRVSDGSHVWSETFERKLTGIFAVQDQVARAVVEALRVQLLPGRPLVAAGQRPPSPEAYEAYLLGRQYQRRGNTQANRRQAAEAFQRALRLEPGYAQAWAGLSGAEFSLADFAATADEVAAAQRRALAAAGKAIALGPELPDGYLARANASFDPRESEADVSRALALSPRDPRALSARGSMLNVLGRWPEAVAPLRKAIELDPLDGGHWLSLASTHLNLGDPAAARADTGRALELTPDDVFSRFWLGTIWLAEGQPATALAEFERVQEEIWRITGTAMAHHSLGHAEEARAALDRLTGRYGHVAGYQIAEVRAWRGETDLAFEWLERAYRGRDPGLFQLKQDIAFRPIAGDPRFRALLRKLKLPEA
jgi:TolB-like protein/tetratricopeptide (TPR) repeat protein